MDKIKEFEEFIDKALEIYMQRENEKSEKELKQNQNEYIEFSKSHKRAMKRIFKQARKQEKLNTNKNKIILFN